MRSLRRIAAWSLLAITVALLVPREQWHTLGHDEHAVEHARSGSSISAACEQCLAGVQAAVAPDAITPDFFSFFHCPQPIEAVQGIFLGFAPLATDRGPPATC